MQKAASKVVGIVLIGITATWTLTARAANPAADEKIAVAQASVQRAEEAGAPQLAPVELESARSKLARAQKAQLERNNKIAADLADQANIDAQVAEASARAQHSHTAAAEFDASMQALRTEAAKQ